jgi:hypothetical protein
MSSLLTQIKSSQFRDVTRSRVTSSILYSLSLTVIAWILTEWVGVSLDRGEPYAEDTYFVSERDTSLSLHVTSRSSPSVNVQITTGLKSYLCTVPTRYTTTENNIINSHAQDTTAFKPNIFVN